MSANATASERLDHYLQIRKRGGDLANEAFALLDKDAIDVCARRLGLLVRDMLVFKNEAESSVLFDYALHDYYVGGRNAVARLRDEDRYPEGSLEAEILDAWCDSRFCMVALTGKAESPEVTGFDQLRQEKISLLDVNLYRTLRQAALFAIRLVPFRDFNISTGAGLPVDGAALAEIGLRSESLGLNTLNDVLGVLSRPVSAAAVSTLILRSCLDGDSSEYMMHGTPGEELPFERMERGGVGGATARGSHWRTSRQWHPVRGGVGVSRRRMAERGEAPSRN